MQIRPCGWLEGKPTTTTRPTRSKTQQFRSITIDSWLNKARWCLPYNRIDTALHIQLNDQIHQITRNGRPKHRSFIALRLPHCWLTEILIDSIELTVNWCRPGWKRPHPIAGCISKGLNQRRYSTRCWWNVTDFDSFDSAVDFDRVSAVSSSGWSLRLSFNPSYLFRKIWLVLKWIRPLSLRLWLANSSSCSCLGWV